MLVLQLEIEICDGQKIEQLKYEDNSESAMYNLKHCLACVYDSAALRWVSQD